MLSRVKIKAALKELEGSEEAKTEKPEDLKGRSTGRRLLGSKMR
jgi:hypothetical protein